MLLFLLTILAGIFIIVAWHSWERCHDDELPAAARGLFLRWLATGHLLPLAAWFVFNTGWLGRPVWPTAVPLAAGGAAWWASFEGALAAALFLVSSHWAGVTFVWLLGRMWAESEDQKKFRATCAGWSLLLLPAAFLVIGVGGWLAAGLALTGYGLALVQATLPLKYRQPPEPSYARAVAQINFGKYEEAELAVLQELEQFEDDFNGWMMLAELSATHFHDLRAADQTIRELCEHPATTSSQMAIARHRLADWHLKFAHDPVAARQALEEICAREPGSHLDKMARLRIQQIPATRAALLEKERGRPLALPHIPDELNPSPAPPLSRVQATTSANECVETLRKNPDDTAAREKLAQLLAENLGDADTALAQMDLLLAMPGQPENQRAEWLVTTAGWQARLRQNPEAAQQLYERVLRDFTATPAAFAAQRRLNLLQLQSRFRRRSAERAPLSQEQRPS